MRTDLRGVLLLGLLAAGCDAGKKAPPPTRLTPAGATLVEANDQGFVPARVQVPPNQPSHLAFRRTSDATCATRVVFPDLKIERDLPLNQDILVDLPAMPGGKEFSFQCGMGMYKSKVVAQ